MEAYICDLVDYNHWANERVCSFIPDHLADVELKSSFPTIRLTLYHIWDAQQIWLRRLKNESITDWPSKSFTGNMAEAKGLFVQTSKELAQFVNRHDNEFLKKEIHYTNMRGEPFKNSVYEILTHVCNHSTFHRGQLVTMLREAGATELKSTDMIVYFRDKHSRG